MKKVLNIFLAVAITVQASMLPLNANSQNAGVTKTPSIPGLSLEHINSDTIPRLWQVEQKSTLNTKTKSNNDEFVAGTYLNNLPEYFEKELVVKFIDTHDVTRQYSDPLMMDFLWWHQASVKSYFKDTNTAVLTLNSEDATVLGWQERLAKDHRVVFAEPNYIWKPQSNKNDYYFDKQWALHNVEQNINGKIGKLDADIDMYEALDVRVFDKKITVAVIDTGISSRNPDLSDSLWDGSRCLNQSGNNLGYCNSGYDFQNFDKTPEDENGHGTLVSGVIAAKGGNARGITGINSDAKIMALKAGTDFFSNEAIVHAINFARHNNAKIINASFGGKKYSQAVYEALKMFTANGGIIVTAAGNNSINVDSSTMYPCNYEIDGLICVASTDNLDNLSSFSNYGSNTIDLAAPGTDIFSTEIAGEYKYWDVQTFENVTAPEKPSVMDFYETAGIVNKDNSTWGNVITGDTNPTYKKDNDSAFYSKRMDLWAADSATIAFWISCDTEYTMNAYSDYLELHYKNNKGNFERQYTYDEYQIDVNNQMPQDSTGFATMHVKYEIPEKYLNGNFQYGFKWHSNNNDNVGAGCFVDDIEVKQFVKNELGSYGFASGTSMAAAHVTGVASYMMRINSNLANVDVKNLLVYSGETLDSLKNKVKNAKRLNANLAINAAINPTNLLKEKPWEQLPSYIEIAADDSITADIKAGDLISVAGHNAVYYYSNDKTRHVFPTEKEFYSWFVAEDFAEIKYISLDDAAKIPLGRQMIMRPGSLIKEPSAPAVYFVNIYGALNHLQNEGIAKFFFGDLWAKLVKDIGASRMLDYKIENPISDRNQSTVLDAEAAQISESGYIKK